jgi:predicted peptidase
VRLLVAVDTHAEWEDSDMSSAPPKVLEQTLQPGSRRFTIAVPEGYADDQPVPLILALHYGWQGEAVPPFYGGGFLTVLVEPAFRALGGIILAPDCTGADWVDPQSEADVLTLLDRVQATYNIDPRKTLVTGYSRGGRGTWHLAARHQDLFKAAIVMAGWPPPDVTVIEWNIPLYVIHSRHDELIPLEPAEAAASRLKAAGVTIELTVVEGITHFETARFADALRATIPWIEEAWQR